jgi:hypothetical protein
LNTRIIESAWRVQGNKALPAKSHLRPEYASPKNVHEEQRHKRDKQIDINYCNEVDKDDYDFFTSDVEGSSDEPFTEIHVDIDDEVEDLLPPMTEEEQMLVIIKSIQISLF